MLGVKKNQDVETDKKTLNIVTETVTSYHLSGLTRLIKSGLL